jgi:hypothetical protein
VDLHIKKCVRRQSFHDCARRSRKNVEPQRHESACAAARDSVGEQLAPDSLPPPLFENEQSYDFGHVRARFTLRRNRRRADEIITIVRYNYFVAAVRPITTERHDCHEREWIACVGCATDQSVRDTDNIRLNFVSHVHLLGLSDTSSFGHTALGNA